MTWKVHDLCRVLDVEAGKQMSREEKRQTLNRDCLWFLKQKHFTFYRLSREVSEPCCTEMMWKHFPSPSLSLRELSPEGAGEPWGDTWNMTGGCWFWLQLEQCPCYTNTCSHLWTPSLRVWATDGEASSTVCVLGWHTHFETLNESVLFACSLCHEQFVLFMTPSSPWHVTNGEVKGNE